VWFGLNVLSVVAVAMKNDFLEVCSHCRRSLMVHLGDDIGFQVF
jgi:hypothetical protein